MTQPPVKIVVDGFHVIEEFLLTKGEEIVSKESMEIPFKPLVDFGIFVYGLKANSTSRLSMKYDLEKFFMRQGVGLRSGVETNKVKVPKEIFDRVKSVNDQFRKNPSSGYFEAEYREAVVPERSFNDGFVKQNFIENLDNITSLRNDILNNLEAVNKINESTTKLDIPKFSLPEVLIKNGDDLYQFSFDVNEIVSKILFARGVQSKDVFQGQLFEITRCLAVMGKIACDSRIHEMAINATKNLSTQGLAVGMRTVLGAETIK